MRWVAAIACAALIVLAAMAGSAQAAATNCPVNASGGFINCLFYAGPSSETAKSWHGAGLPYRFQLHRGSDGAFWGPWQWADMAYHVVFLNLSGTIVAQIDNQGSANPASYWVELA